MVCMNRLECVIKTEYLKNDGDYYVCLVFSHYLFISVMGTIALL
jgi:hypothetical protein